VTVPTDTELLAAVELARTAAVEVGAESVGQHLGVSAEPGGAATHRFAADLPGYRGWHWAVTVNHVPGYAPTVAEVVLLPGQSALQARPWVPWSERLQPGDLGPGDLLPTVPDDPRLAPSYVLSEEDDDKSVEVVALELGMGRARVLSREGRLDAAERWYQGLGGPDTPMARQAPGRCGTCGFMVSIAGSLRAAFGVCANEVAPTDGQVVSVEFGCGAHSETVVQPAAVELGEVFDDSELDLMALSDLPTEEVAVEAGVAVEQTSVDAVDAYDSGGAQTQDESRSEEFVEPDGPQLDAPPPVAGGVEETPAGDAGEDVVGEGSGGDEPTLFALLDDGEIAATGLEGEPADSDE